MRRLLLLLFNFRCQRSNRDCRRIIIADIVLKNHNRTNTALLFDLTGTPRLARYKVAVCFTAPLEFGRAAIAPMSFMTCSRRLDHTGMYLQNEYSVFTGHPDFRPYKVSLTFSVFYAAGLGQKKYPVGFPTRHRRRFYSVFCKLVPVYLLVTI